MIIGSAIAGLLLGFMAGLFTFRIKQKWCRTCGGTLRCLSCTVRLHQLAASTLNTGKW